MQGNATPARETKTGNGSAGRRGKIVSFTLAFGALGAVRLTPPIDSIGRQSQNALDMLAFAVVMWLFEAVSYPVGAVLISGLISLLVGLSPNPEDPAKLFGTSKALGIALGGFSTSAVALVAAALALATAMQATGLHRRIGLYVLRSAGEKRRTSSPAPSPS